jgi:hypothetical protein
VRDRPRFDLFIGNFALDRPRFDPFIGNFALERLRVDPFIGNFPLDLPAFDTDGRAKRVNPSPALNAGEGMVRCAHRREPLTWLSERSMPPRMSTKKPGASSPGTHSSTPHVLTPVECFAKYRGEAERLAERDVVPARDVDLAVANVKSGVASLAPHLLRLAEELPKVPSAHLGDAHDVALGLLHAAGLVGDHPATVGQVKEKEKQLHALREPMLLIGEGLALLGYFPLSRVEEIRAGHGPYDAGKDGLDLHKLYTEFAPAIANKHPFDETRLGQVLDLGTWLVRNVTPKGAVKPSSATPDQAAAALRDRFWTLLVRRHADLRKAGFCVFGETVDAHVPLLQSRVVERKLAAPTGATPPPKQP